MKEVHPNLIMLERLAQVFPHNLAKAGDLFSEHFVWHYFNPNLPEIAGDYEGLEQLNLFFQKLQDSTGGTFRVTDKQLIHVGDELVVTYAKPSMRFNGKTVELDSLLIWRVVEGQFCEAWDIPAVNTMRAVASQYAVPRIR